MSNSVGDPVARLVVGCWATARLASPKMITLMVE
jgi:hypothetical protein